jgi:lipopolysaccharide transport system ATP-binding protein
MSNTAIKVENLSKIYRLGEIGTGSIGQDVDRWFKTKVLGKEDPFLKIGEANDRANKGNSDIVYSLRDIDFEIEQGDAVGIIGRNGAGKSTLLKILSRVTTPTTGRINIKGRVASLLEVGTGFHPELTGRENIFLNGAILGMRKREIVRKLEEIIDFSGVERYIDTPVKRYSSGMYVRLAFAVAAHLESEILIVDEVLAVGDAEFQKKCLDKMGAVSKGEGRTVLFVSHNLHAVSKFCKYGLYLNNGKVAFSGDLPVVLTEYAKSNEIGGGLKFSNNRKSVDLEQNIICEAEIIDEKGSDAINKKYITIVFIIHNIYLNHQIDISFTLKNNSDIVIFQDDKILNERGEIQIGYYRVSFQVPIENLNIGTYVVDAWLGKDSVEIIGGIYTNILGFEISQNHLVSRSKIFPGILAMNCDCISEYSAANFNSF